MGLETGTFVSSLNANNPASGDTAAQGDDHLRLIKSTIKNTFPNANKAFRFPTSLAAQTALYAIDGTSGDGVTVPVNARAGGITVNLPLAPAVDGFRCRVVKADHSINLVTVSGQGNLVNGATTLILYQRYQMAEFIWCSATSEWFATRAEIPEVGSWLQYSGSSAPIGYVLASGLTIGNADSGATGRANADCLALFQHLWNTYSNTICPVSGGRGLTALADFDADKTITLLDAKGRLLAGKDDMGGTAANRLTTAKSGIDGGSLGATGGTEEVMLAQSDLPNETLSVSGTTGNAGAHTHTIYEGSSTSLRLRGGLISGGSVGGGQEGAFFTSSGGTTATISTSDNHAHTFSGDTSSLNGGVTQTGVANAQPTLVQNLCLKL